MNIQAILTQEMHELRRCNPAFHALLNQLLHHKGGTGNYSVDRHEWLDENPFGIWRSRTTVSGANRHEWLDEDPDIETLAARIQRGCEAAWKNESA